MSTSNPPPSPNPAAARGATSRRGRRLQIWIVLIGVVVAGLVMFLIIRTQGHVTGEEFAPSHFESRRFEFYEIPFLHVQITPIRRTGTTSDAARYLRQQSLVTVPAGPPDRWHLVHLARGVTGATPGDAGLLLSQLRLREGGATYWKRWSDRHPQQAAILWPIVQRLASRELYILLPSLLELAQRESDAGKLRSALDDYVRREYQTLIDDMRAAGREALADQLAEEARSEFPDGSDGFDASDGFNGSPTAASIERAGGS